MHRHMGVWAACGAVACAAGVVLGAGPDVIVGDINEVLKWGTVGGVTGYSLGTNACSIGTQPVQWAYSTNQHPLIATGLYRMRTVNGGTRMEQIGMSWLKNAFHMIPSNFCGTCNETFSQALSPGCSDPYSAWQNGSQATMGARSEVNPFTGVFPFPFTLAWNQTGDAIYKRIQVRNADVDPALNAGATYFAEALYVAPDDAAAGNAGNNASWRRLVVQSQTEGGWNLALVGTTRQKRCAVQAWKEFDPSVNLVAIDVPGDGQLITGSLVTDLGGGWWRYEYAVQNLNCHRGVRRFVAPFGGGVSVRNVEFAGVAHHSGEVYDTGAWSGVVAGGVTWSVSTYAQNPNANALRWGTLYNFRFEANQPPSSGAIELGLFRPGAAGDPASVSFAAMVPTGGATPPPSCPGDANGDGVVSGVDLSVVLSGFGDSVTPMTGADFNGDGVVNGQDLSVLLAMFGTSC